MQPMLEQWVIEHLNPIKGEMLVILADPQGMIRAGARAVDGWAKENRFTALYCSGNLGLRELYENLRDNPNARLIVVDRTPDKAKLPRSYPDLEARCEPNATAKSTCIAASALIRVQSTPCPLHSVTNAVNGAARDGACSK
jgi:hypothetical protein